MYVLQGYLFGLLSAFLSALAAVYTEWVMKRNNDSLYWQNIQLYSFGILFNGLGLVVNNFREGAVLPPTFSAQLNTTEAVWVVRTQGHGKGGNPTLCWREQCLSITRQCDTNMPPFGP